MKAVQWAFALGEMQRLRWQGEELITSWLWRGETGKWGLKMETGRPNMIHLLE